MSNKESLSFSLFQLLFSLFAMTINIFLLIIIASIKPNFWALFIVFIIIIAACGAMIYQSLVAFLKTVKEYIKEATK